MMTFTIIESARTDLYVVGTINNIPFDINQTDESCEIQLGENFAGYSNNLTWSEIPLSHESLLSALNDIYQTTFQTMNR